MPGTWRELHYLQRPAKNIERRMIADLFHRLDRVRALDEWRYVGMGSVYFADFALFHRTIGFGEMINIESEASAANQERFTFNKPFDCVDLRWGKASNVLPGLAWDVPSVVWLDYDGVLDSEKLADVASVVTSGTTPTFLLVSVNVDSSGDNVSVLESFTENVTPQRVPAGTVADDVGGWGLAELAWKVLAAEIASAVADRNGVIDEQEDEVEWRQLLHFQYADGAKMLTVGGLVSRLGDSAAVDSADLAGLFFTKTDHSAFRIRVPNITNREILHLAHQMPKHHDDLDHQGIPERERRDFASAYRYFPAYVAVDL